MNQNLKLCHHMPWEHNSHFLPKKTQMLLSLEGLYKWRSHDGVYKLALQITWFIQSVQTDVFIKTGKTFLVPRSIWWNVHGHSDFLMQRQYDIMQSITNAWAAKTQAKAICFLKMLTVGLNYDMLAEHPGVFLDVALMAIKYMYILTVHIYASIYFTIIIRGI